MAKQIEDNMSPFQRAISEGLVEDKSTVSTETGKKRGSPFANDQLKWVPVFLDALTDGNSVTGASNIAGVHPTLVHRKRREDEVFRNAWNEVCEVRTRLLEQEAQRRAYHGTLRPVYQKGECVGHIREFSDTLMIFLLKARRPEKYRDGVEDSVRSNVVVNITVEDKKLDGPQLVEVITVGDSNQQDVPGVCEAAAVP